jgi:hypothetical protein
LLQIDFVKIPPRLAGLAFLVSLSCIVISVASAQSPTPTPSASPTATPSPLPSPSPGVPPTDHTPQQALITFDDQSSVNVRGGQGHFPRVAARTNEELTIQLQYSTDLGGQPITVESPDGAQVIGDIGNLAVGADGTATLQVRMGGTEGLYRFGLFCSDSYTLLSFYASAP